jgi:3-hydroxyacyl-CoA dehydrogenase
MAEWITTANGIIALITGLVGLIGTGIGAYFAIKNWITVVKTKSSQEIWNMIMTIADEAMKEAEKSTLSGADKKQMVIDTVKTACRTAGVDLDMFIDQLSAYIDDTVKFANSFKK